MQTPLIIVNFKTYDSAIGEHAVYLAKICETAAKKTGTHIAIAVCAPDIYRIAQEVTIPVLAQHVDNVKFGSHTGYILPEDIIEAGAIGTLLNHSEHRLKKNILASTIKRARVLHLQVVACAEDNIEAKEIARFYPDFIAVEPPELIGGNISVSTANPELIVDSVNAVNTIFPIPVLVGAGVKTSSDVKTSLVLGAKGILVASAITKAKDPYAALMELIRGID